MRLTTVFVATLCIMGIAHADDPAGSFMEGPINMPSVPDAFYCQQPASNFYANNASSGFSSEIVDDIPDEFDGRLVQAVTVYLAEWGGGFIPPVNIVVNFYDDDCPPDTSAVVSYVVPWVDVMATELQSDPSSWYVVELTVPLSEPIELGSTGSIGWYADNSSSQAPPYCGAILTDDNAVWGDCGTYWAGDYWGYPRWTALSGYYNEVVHELAYCLWDSEPNPVLTATWGKIKSLYK